MLLHLGELLHLGLQQPTGQNISGLFVMNLTSHVIKRRQHLIERDEDLHAVIEWKKKNSILYDRSKQIIIEIYRLHRNCYLADSMNNALE